MVSKNKKRDKEFLLELGDYIIFYAKRNQIELAEGFGEIYIALEEKIKSHDYTKEDLIDERVDTMMEEIMSKYENK